MLLMVLDMSLPIVHSQQSKFQQLADSMEKDGHIGFCRRMVAPIYVHLRASHLFARLVSLYTQAFKYQWHHFKHFAESFNIQNSAAIAICYVSAWFIDLYVSNRECVNKFSLVAATTDHFISEEIHITKRYDAFLCHLNAVIRPTQIVNALADAVYIALIAKTIDWSCNNPFGIKDFELDKDLVCAIVDVMESGSWKMSTLTDDTFGCPSWLFDWKSDKAYSWFPFKGNFGGEDLVVIPYILGIPCSPRLGPCDVDDWQYFPGGNLPDYVQVQDYVRSTERRFYGNAEFRTINYELHTIEWPTTCSARSGTKRSAVETGFSSPADEVTRSFMAYRYQLIDWTYQSMVLCQVNSQRQYDCFFNLLFPGLY